MSGFIIRNFIHTLYLIILKICFICYLFIFRTYDVKRSLKKEEMEYDEKYLDFKTLIIMGIATSLDSLLVGLTFSILPFYQTFLYTVEIGIVTAIIAGLGFILGEKFGNILGQKSHFLGAALLIFIAINILF
ncbi:manganese efflux pump [Fusobacterium animalis]|uniref:manganese efflux pump n=1 Tax=Fusobacterium animalis TaxID=76859 RepID=UPI0030CBD5F9